MPLYFTVEGRAPAGGTGQSVSLQLLERFWLKDGEFVAGREISIADLMMVTELDMLHMLSGSPEVSSSYSLPSSI